MSDSQGMLRQLHLVRLEQMERLAQDIEAGEKWKAGDLRATLIVLCTATVMQMSVEQLLAATEDLSVGFDWPDDDERPGMKR